MQRKPKSIFNLIEIFRNGRKSTTTINIIPQTHCAEKHHHDFYCDAEKPFISL